MIENIVIAEITVQIRGILTRDKIVFFTITAEILARSLANFYRQYADRHMILFEIRTTRQRARAGNSTICYRKNKLTSVFHASVLLLIMNFVITLSK